MSTAAAVAARLKLKKRIAPEADANEPHPPAAPSAPKLPPSPPDTGDFAEGATVEGNFKGLGDWDEALIVGRNRDGTYTLEYVDEGLIEEAVPASHIRLLVASADKEPERDGQAAQVDASDIVFSPGQTVLANFKGLGDWDEALVIGRNADGTYAVEYVDEGLVEESVPASHIVPSGGADAAACAGISLEVDADEVAEEERLRVALLAEAEQVGGGARRQGLPPERPPAAPLADASEEEEEEEGDDDEEVEGTEDDAIMEATDDFVPSSSWRSAKRGYCFKRGESGLGYYRDVPLHEAAEAEERRRLVLTAPQIVNWAVELLSMPPSINKVDRFVSLFDLSALHVHVLSAAAKASSGGSAAPGKPAPGKAGPSKAALFDSLQSWFDAQLPMLATQLPHGAVETTLRVFLAPQQSVRQGLQHVTFSVDWVRVQSGGDAATEPYSTALLHRLGMAGRRPPKMLLVMMYRAEHNQVTDVWVDVDREGLGAKKGATLDDVLLSDVFDTCLTLARKGGAVGSLDPIFHNYYQAAVVG